MSMLGAFATPVLQPIGQRTADVLLPAVSVPSATTHPAYGDPRAALALAEADLAREQRVAAADWPVSTGAAVAGGIAGIIIYLLWKAHTESHAQDGGTR